ncbi:hypothetical protein [uncultured Paracoccus sp.]|uniref:hypothetical protein n=1 Tax=uncultured Paracoccus sp. TaxID=189685 RepID=UPI0026075C2F|nr:hypothetical protein [uncultured Paracoccus sp.]
MADPVLILTMKWGTLYGAEDVNRLARQVRRNLSRPYRFICFTDDSTGIGEGVEPLPLPDLGRSLCPGDTRWRKLALFGKDLEVFADATALFLDLDLVVVDDLSPFFDLQGGVFMIRDDDLFRPKRLRGLRPARDRFLHSVGNSSVFRYEVGAHDYILDAYLQDPAAARRAYEISQQFQSAQLAARGHLDYWPRGWCVSFKNDCVGRGPRSWWADPALPPGARIVVFAGNPKMGDVFAGRGQTWYRRIGEIDWLRQAWQG